MTMTPKIEKYFRVKYGFTALDRVSIQVDELEKALYAQKFGEVVQLKGRQINGKYIISIAPDYHKYTGWYESYNPLMDADDLAQIERDCPKDLDNIIEKTRERVDWLVSHDKRKLIGENISIPELDKAEETKKLNPEIKKNRTPTIIKLK